MTFQDAIASAFAFSDLTDQENDDTPSRHAAALLMSPEMVAIRSTLRDFADAYELRDLPDHVVKWVMGE